MAAGNFEVDTNQLRHNVSDMRESYQRLKSAQQDLQNRITMLAAMWKGKARDAVHTEFEKNQLAFQEISKQIDELLVSMDSAAREYDVCDTKVRSAIDQIRV